MSELIELMRSFEEDHTPGGWPGVQMRQVYALCDEVDRLQSRVAELEAICENVPEGCTPADARVLREANHRLIAEVVNLEKRAAIRGELCRATLKSKAEIEKERDGLAAKLAHLESLSADELLRPVVLLEDVQIGPSDKALAKLKADAVREFADQTGDHYVINMAIDYNKANQSQEQAHD